VAFPLAAWIERRPGAAFAALAALHAVVWTALPTVLYKNLPLDLIEALTYGREWQLGYDKLPPLPWWLVEIAYRTFNSDFAYYCLGQISVLVAFAAVWTLMLRIATPAAALAAGASRLVIGRPITQAADPVAAFQEILAEVEAAG
jgi:hypothetical protein